MRGRGWGWGEGGSGTHIHTLVVLRLVVNCVDKSELMSCVKVEVAGLGSRL